MNTDEKIIAQIIHERDEWHHQTGSMADIVFMPDNLLSQQVSNIENMEVRYSPLIPKGSFILSVKSELNLGRFNQTQTVTHPVWPAEYPTSPAYSHGWNLNIL